MLVQATRRKLLDVKRAKGAGMDLPSTITER